MSDSFADHVNNSITCRYCEEEFVDGRKVAAEEQFDMHDCPGHKATHFECLGCGEILPVAERSANEDFDCCKGCFRAEAEEQGNRPGANTAPSFPRV